MKPKALMMGLLLAAGMAHAQQNNNQYFQEQQQIQQQQHAAEQARQGYMQSQGQQAASQPAGEWKTTWGAIGGNALKGILGASTGMPDEQAAVQAALNDCRAKGGGDGCKLDISYYNQCAVLVTGNRVYNTSSAATVEQAAKMGINKCAKEDMNCRVFYSACSKPQFVRY